MEMVSGAERAAPSYVQLLFHYGMGNSDAAFNQRPAASDKGRGPSCTIPKRGGQTPQRV
jgi:hypothetical protein